MNTLFPLILDTQGQITPLSGGRIRSKFELSRILLLAGSSNRIGSIATEKKWRHQFISIYAFMHVLLTCKYLPRCEKTGLRGFRPGPTLNGLCNQIRWSEA